MLKPSSQLRRLLAEHDGVIVKPGAYNALSAKLVEKAGFSCVGVSGYAVSASLLGRPDMGFLTLTEITMVTRYIVDAVSIPVIADADTGFGNALNTMRTVEDFIRTGAAAIHIEDQVSPKRCGHVAGKEIIPIEEAVGKFRAAAHVRDQLDPDFVIIARTDARGVPGGSVEAVIERALAYVDAGADMIFPEALLTVEELAEVVSRVPVPIHYNRTGVSPMLGKPQLTGMGVRMVSNASGMLRSASRGMVDYINGFRDDDDAFLRTFQAGNEGHAVSDFHSFVDFPRFLGYEDEFLPQTDIEKKYNGSIGFTRA